MAESKSDYALAVLAGVLSGIAVFALCAAVSENYFPKIEGVAKKSSSPKSVTAVDVKDEILMLARAIHSESDRDEERLLIGWIIRNRVDSNYRDKRTYKSTILDPKQFSAFNGGPSRFHHLSFGFMGFGTGNQSWDRALLLARKIYHASPEDNPLPRNVLHFYSPVSMVDEDGKQDITQVPYWAKGHKSLYLPNINPLRLKVFESID